MDKDDDDNHAENGVAATSAADRWAGKRSSAEDPFAVFAEWSGDADRLAYLRLADDKRTRPGSQAENVTATPFLRK